MRRRTRYDPTPLEADSLWQIERGPQGVPGASGPASMIPGPVGPQGEPGADAKGWTFRGEWKRTATYKKGDVVTDDGSTYLAHEPSNGKSPPGKQWALIAERGRDGESLAGQRGRPGRDGVTTIINNSSPLAFIADENILKGQPLRVTTSGHCSLADASAYATSEVVAVSTTDTASALA